MSEVECYGGIAEIDGARWDALAATHDLGYSAPYLRYLESQQPGRRPVLLLGDAAACCLSELNPGSPLADKPADLLSDRVYLRIAPDDDAEAAGDLRAVLARHAEGELPGTVDDLLKKAWQVFIAKVGVPLVVRNLWDSRILLAANLEPAERLHSLARMVSAVKSQAISRGYRSAAFIYTPGEDRALGRALSAAGFRRAMIGGLATIDLSGCTTMDDYLARFRSPARISLKAELRKFDAAKLEVRQIDHDTALLRIAELEVNNGRKYDRGTSLAAQLAVNTALSSAFGNQLVACGVSYAGRLIAATVMIRGSAELRVLMYGADYDVISGLPGVYASAVFYWPIRYALELGIKTVSLGYESYEAKLLRGARLQPRYISVWSASAAGSSFLADWMDLADNRARQVIRALELKYEKRWSGTGPARREPRRDGDHS